MTETYSIELMRLSCPAVKLRFERVLDRWSHCWCTTDHDDHDDHDHQHRWMRSIEGTPDQNWPPSPPLQELNQLSLALGNSVLGVGMAGRSHWSASYSIEQSSDGSSFIKSDLACLQKKPESEPSANSNSNLGSTYEFGEDCVIDRANETRIEIVTPSTRRIILEAFEDEDCATVFRLHERRLTIVPRQISPSSARASRWAFRVKVTR